MTDRFRMGARSQHFEIVGSGLYLPQVVLSAEDIDRRAGLAEGWAGKHGGVLQRHECVPPESLATMACEAITAALKDADRDWSDIDLLMDASTCRHQPIPCNAALVQAECGAEAAGVPCVDVQTTCLGFILGLHMANGLFAAGGYRNIVLVCSEAGLAGVNWSEPESACLMGDGAAAVVLRAAPPRSTYSFIHETHSQHLETCQVRGGGHNRPPFEYGPETDHLYRFQMDGPRLFRIARKLLPPMTGALLKEAAVPREQLHIVPHQASPRAVESVRRLLKWDSERYHDRAARLGNLAAASIPAVLHLCRRDNLLHRGHDVMLLGTSAGYSQAAMIFRL